MPNPMTESAVESIELEQVDSKIAELVPLFDGDYTFFRSRAKKEMISSATAAGGTTGRPSWRNSMVIQGGAPIVTGTGDQTSLLRGTGINTASFAQSPVGFFGVTEYTYLSEIATQGRERGLTEISTSLVKRSLNSFLTGIAAQIAGPGVGSGTIAIIPSTATVSSNSGTGAQTSYISGITNAASFTDQQVVQVFPSEGGSTRGNATVSFTDPVAQTVWFSTVLPSTGGATATGDYLVISGASGAQGAGLANIRYWNVNSNTGTVGGLNRASYPGRLSTPTINLNGAQVTPSVFQRALILLGRAMGPDAEAMSEMVWYGQPDQLYTLNAQWYERMITQNMEGKSANNMDIGRKELSKTFGGREYQISYQADPTRIDGLVMSNWAFGELKEVGLYDFGGGNTVMPVPDVGTTNGTYITDRMFAYDAFFQLCNKAPRSGLFIQNAGVLPV
jgi:hypothetical protein